MTRYFIVLGKQHTPSSFRVVLLLEDHMLVHRHLELYGPGEFILDENVTTDRYVVEAFLRKREYTGRQWQEVAEEDYAPLEKQWRACYPAAVAARFAKPRHLRRKLLDRPAQEDFNGIFYGRSFL
jgi:hypothetical protein